MCVVFARDKSVIAPQSARRLGVASLLFSIIGIIVGIIAIVLIIVLFVVYGVHRSAETYQSVIIIFICLYSVALPASGIG